MKKEFTLDEFIASTGCYLTIPNKSKDLAMSLIKNDVITVEDLLLSNIPTEDKIWWIRNSCRLTTKEFQYWALNSAKSVANIYNKKYPNDNRISMCINITSRYLKGLVSLDVLIKYKRSTYDVVYGNDRATMCAARTAYSAANATIYAAADAAIYYDANYDAANAATNAAIYAAIDAAHDDATSYAAANAANDAAANAAIYAAVSYDYTTNINKIINNWIKLFKTFNNENN